MSTLYRKYRPQTFEEVVGQNHIKLTLRHEIETGKIAHAYIFCGPRAVGKTTMARVLAKAVNCPKLDKKAIEPCNNCDSCNEITAGRHIDIIEIDAASNTGVDNVRENIIANARVAPVSAKYKVFIIDEVHMLSISSFNALLKIIEEPPTYVIFVLCTTEIHKVPNTIISRCQRFDFKKITIADIAKKLTHIAKTEKIDVEKKVIESIARQSQGYMRDAESLFGQVLMVAAENGKGTKKISSEDADLIIPRSDLEAGLNLLEMLLKKDSANSIALINKLIHEGVDLKIFINDFIDLLRKTILNKISPSLSDKYGMDLGDGFESKLIATTHNYPVERLTQIIDKFIKSSSELKGSSIIQLPVELAIIELCQTIIEPKISSPVATTISSAKEAKPIKNSPSKIETNSSSMQLSPEEIKNKWNEVLIKIKKHNHSLSFILKVCEPRNFENDQLQLAFKYKFHRERVSDPQIKVLIDKTLHEVFGYPLTYVAFIDESMEIIEAPVAKKEEKKNEDSPEAGNMIDNLLKTFGGKIVS